jgi:hypothetical protein
MKLEFTPKQAADFNKETEIGTKLKLIYVDPSKISNKSADSSTLQGLDRLVEDIYDRLDTLGFAYLFKIEILDIVNGHLTKTDPPLVTNMCLNQGYHLLDENHITNYVNWLIHYKEQDHEHRMLVLRELRQSYNTVIASMDPALVVQVKDRLRANYGEETNESSRIHFNGPLALFTALSIITFVNPLTIRNIVDRIRALKLSSYAGENIATYAQHCKTLISRIPRDQNQDQLFFSDILETLTTTGNDLFNGDIQHWERNNRYHNVESKLPALLKHAETLYTQYLHSEKWLQTKKHGSGFNAAAAAPAKDASTAVPQPEANAAPATTKSKRRGGKKRDPPAAWRLIPPVNGESPKKVDENGKTIWWCKECKLWSYTHDTRNHKTPEELQAAREAKKASKSDSAPKTTRFSDGSAPVPDS